VKTLHIEFGAIVFNIYLVLLSVAIEPFRKNTLSTSQYYFDFFVYQKRMVILSLLAYGVYKERQKLQALSEAGKDKPENNNTIAAAAVTAVTAAATAVTNAANAATAAANGATATAASTSTVKSKASTVLCESDRRKRALQEWKAKHKAQLERRQQQDAETEGKRGSASKEDTETGQVAALKLREENSGEKVVPAAEKKVVPSAERGEAPRSAAKPVLGVTADKEELVAGPGRPKKMLPRPPALTSSALEDSGPAAVFMPILQPPVAKTAIKFHLKSLAKPTTTDAAATAKAAEKIELIDLSGEEDESGGDQLIKARNLLRSSQDRLGKNDLHICVHGKNTISLIMVITNPTKQ
jgi:hypothetical protein